MDSNPYLLQIFILLILIILSAFFSASETALISIGHIKRKKILSDKRHDSKYLELLFKNPAKMITTILVGSTIANILSSIIATLIFVDALPRIGINNEALITVITTFTMTSILLLFGEISPKTLALKNAEKYAIFLSRPVYYCSVILYPIIEVFSYLSHIITAITRSKSLEKHSLVSEEEIKIFINLGLQEGILEKEEEKMLTLVIEFADIVVREIMTPRTEIIAVEIKSSVHKIINVIKKHWHSRIPVYYEKMDNIAGFVYAKDLLSVGQNNVDDTNYLKTILRESFFVPESKRIDDLLREMQKEKKHIAMVVDEYGGISGLVTIEDILEEIVGEIQDEYDGKEDVMIETINENEYIINGLINVSDLNNELGLQLPEEDDYDSLAGFVVQKMGRIPRKGEIYEEELIKFEILQVIKRRITKIKLSYKVKGEE